MALAEAEQMLPNELSMMLPAGTPIQMGMDTRKPMVIVMIQMLL